MYYLKYYIFILLNLLFIVSISQRSMRAFELRVKFESNKSQSRLEVQKVIYTQVNREQTDIIGLVNPIIGYKSDRSVDGFFEVEIDSSRKWLQYGAGENNDYDYQSPSKAIKIKPKQEINQTFNLGSLYHFKPGVYRVRLVLYQPNSGRSISIKSNWITFVQKGFAGISL